MKEDKKYLEEQSDAVGTSIVPVSKAEGEALAKKIKAKGYFETSSLRREGIEEFKNALLTEINSNHNTNFFKKHCTLL